MAKNHKYIFVVGGVMSGVGKGVTTSSIGMLLEAKGYKVNMVKVDPYLNIDAGTMNPTEHGEVFVLNNGLETDQDMGNYERFLGRDIHESGYMTSGMVYKTVIDRERALEYGGKCVEAIPDIRDEIINRLRLASKQVHSDISIIEIGGTVGDYQNIMFIEAARVLKAHCPRDVIFIMVSYMPSPTVLGEMKSKPTQNAIRQLNSYGVNTDIVIARSRLPMDEKRREKIANSCSIMKDQVISAPNVDSIYGIPLNFEKDGLSETISRLLGLRPKKPDLAKWKGFIDSANKAINSKREISIAIVGKYFDTGDGTLSDAYISVIEATKISAFANGVKANLTWVNSKEFEADPKKIKSLSKFDGIIVPGGFGSSGIEGVIETIKFARVNKIPYFGLCYGMQLMVIEYARNILGWKDANTAEINPKASKVVVHIMPDQEKKLKEKNMGGSMRLGAYKAKLKEGTIARRAYARPASPSASADGGRGTAEVVERHRHRYEVNNDYVSNLEKAGLVFSGTSPDGRLMEIAELPENKHPFFLGTQFHPEFLARPLSPHPLFSAFVEAVVKNKRS